MTPDRQWRLRSAALPQSRVFFLDAFVAPMLHFKWFPILLSRATVDNESIV
jgi:hypothetical protein